MEKVALQIYKTKLLLNVFVLHSHYNNYLLEIMIWWYRIHHIFYPSTPTSFLVACKMNDSSYFLTHNARCKCKLSTFTMRSKLGVKWFISCYNLWTQTGYIIILQTFNMILVEVILVPEDHISNPMLLLPLSYQWRVTQTAASSI